MKFRFFFLILLLRVANTFASDLDFTLVNHTGRSFEGLYITSTDNKNWDANLLINGEVLVAGGKIRVRFKHDAKSPTWDFNLGKRAISRGPDYGTPRADFPDKAHSMSVLLDLNRCSNLLSFLHQVRE